MNASTYAYILKSIKKNKHLVPTYKTLHDKTFIITGGSNGIGFNMAKKLALKGANVVITGKSINNNAFQNNVNTASEYICSLVNEQRCTGIKCDLRDTKDIQHVLQTAIKTYGHIDGLVLNASANGKKEQSEDDIYNLSQVNMFGNYMIGNMYLQYASNKHIGHLLVVSPPLDFSENEDWWSDNMFHSLCKYNMTLMAKNWNKRFTNIGVNTLWPNARIATASASVMYGGLDLATLSRKCDIMGDAACHILQSNPLHCHGNHFLDEEVLVSLNIDVENYKVNPNVKEKYLSPY